MSIPSFTNRTISDMTPATHEQVKQWSTYFVKPDLNAGQHSGKARQYDFNEAFKILFGGSLIRFLNYKINEAQHILKDVDTWLESKAWAPMENVKFWESSGKLTKAPPRWSFKNLFPDLTLLVAGKGNKFGYIIREVLSPDYENIEDLAFVKAENWHEEDRDPFQIHGWNHHFGDTEEHLKYVPRVLHLWDVVNRLGAGWVTSRMGSQ